MGLSLHLSLSPFTLHLSVSLPVSISASLKFLSAAQINSLSSTSLFLANSAPRLSPSPLLPTPQAPRGALRSTPGPSASLTPSLPSPFLPASPLLSHSLSTTSLLPPPRLPAPPRASRGCGCHIAACGVPRAADSAFPRPRLSARSCEAVPARPPPALAHQHFHRPSRPARTTSEGTQQGRGMGEGGRRPDLPGPEREPAARRYPAVSPAARPLRTHPTLPRPRKPAVSP